MYRHIGYKMGGWHDVGWYQAEVQPVLAQPEEPLSVRDLVETSRWHDAVRLGLDLYLAGNEKGKTKKE